MVCVTVVGERLDGDAAAGVEQPDNLYVLGIHQFDQIFQDDVDTVLVKISMVTETEKIELEAFAFHHLYAGNIIDDDVSEIGLASFGTQ